MAEIHVEPKKHTSNSWIWIVLALLAAAALVYYLVTRDKNTGTTTEPANTTGAISQPRVWASNTMYLC